MRAPTAVQESTVARAVSMGPSSRQADLLSVLLRVVQ
jgi:hypothetical protein